MVWQDASTHLEAELRFEKAVHGLAVGAAIGIVDSLVGTHYIARACSNCILERPWKVSSPVPHQQGRTLDVPKIELMHGSIVNV
jgi:hypothetical protein